jgi:hypothetical protein
MPVEEAIQQAWRDFGAVRQGCQRLLHSAHGLPSQDAARGQGSDEMLLGLPLCRPWDRRRRINI